MAVIRYKNQCEYAFLHWMDQFPESFHFLDMERFYSFAKSVAIYRGKRWLDYSYFKGRILQHTSHFSEENIETFSDKLHELVNYHRTPPVPVVGGVKDERYGVYQRGAINGIRYEVPISKEEYYGGGASAETLKNATFF